MEKSKLCGLLIVLASFLILSQSVFAGISMIAPANTSKWNQTRASLTFNVSSTQLGNVTILYGPTSSSAVTAIGNNATITLNHLLLWDLSAVADGRYWINVTLYNMTNITGFNNTDQLNITNITGFVTVDSTAPSIVFSAPTNHRVVETSPMTISYTPTDVFGMNRCILHMTNHTAGFDVSGTYSVVENDASITVNASNSFSVGYGRNDMVWYYLECWDSHDNRVQSSGQDNQLSIMGEPPITPGVGGGGPIGGGGIPGTAVGVDFAGIQEAVKNNLVIVLIIAGIGVVVFNKPIKKALRIK